MHVAASEKKIKELNEWSRALKYEPRVFKVGRHTTVPLYEDCTRLSICGDDRENGWATSSSLGRSCDRPHCFLCAFSRNQSSVVLVFIFVSRKTRFQLRKDSCCQWCSSRGVNPMPHCSHATPVSKHRCVTTQITVLTTTLTIALGSLADLPSNFLN